MEEFIRVGRQTLFPQLANDPVCSAGMKALMERLTESLLAQIWLLVVYERKKNQMLSIIIASDLQWEFATLICYMCIDRNV